MQEVFYTVRSEELNNYCVLIFEKLFFILYFTFTKKCDRMSTPTTTIKKETTP